MIKWKGFDNQVQLTNWVNNNLVRTSVVNIVWLAPALVLFYKDEDTLYYQRNRQQNSRG